MNKKWLIWSNEYNAWWCAFENGYPKKAHNAGRYTYEEAVKIVNGANICIAETGKANETMCQAPEDYA